MKKMIISVVIILLIAIALSIIPTQNSKFVDIKNKFLPPSAEHIMGTDHLGRDIFSLMAQGFLRTLCVVLIASAVSYSVGLALGIVAGFYGGAALSVIRFLTDLTLIIPTFIVALIASIIFSDTVLAVGLALGFSNIGFFANQSYKLSEIILRDPYVDTLRMLQVSNSYIMRKFLLPELLAPSLNLMGNKASNHILAYASLTFIGLGADITAPDFGTMLYQYRGYIIDKPLIVLWPALGIFFLSLIFHYTFDEVNI